jgi:hypothetical protein
LSGNAIAAPDNESEPSFNLKRRLSSKIRGAFATPWDVHDFIRVISASEKLAGNKVFESAHTLYPPYRSGGPPDRAFRIDPGPRGALAAQAI